MKLFNQRNTGKAWGFFMQIIQQEAIFIQAIILVLSLITTGSVLQIRGYEIPLWLLVVIVVVIIIVGGLFVFVIGMPSYFSAFNDQFAKHDNPIMKRMDDFEKNQKKIMEKLGIKDED